MKKLILVLTFVSSVASAARLDDVTILNITPGQDNFEVKLQAKDAPKDSYFYLDISKSDPDAFDKLGQVVKKMVGREKYRLDLDIPSFSAFPYGSYYKSDSLTFYGSSDRQPNATKPAKKQKK